MKLFRAAFLGLASGATMLFGASAWAGGDLAPERPFSWTGFYVGWHVGVGASDVDWQYANTPATSTDHDGGGVLGGGQVGFNWQTGTIVLGVEADGSWTNIDGGTACPNAAFKCSHEVNWMASVRGRIGTTALNPRSLVYVTAGWGWADIDYDATIPGNPTVFAFSETHSGWVVGGGIELATAANTSLKIEYLGYLLDGATAPPGTLGAGAAALDPTIHTFRFGMNYRF